MISDLDYKMLLRICKKGIDGIPAEFEDRCSKLMLSNFLSFDSQSNRYRLSLAGEDAIQEYKSHLRNRRTNARRYWITTGIAILALLISIIALSLELYDRGFPSCFTTAGNESTLSTPTTQELPTQAPAASKDVSPETL